jgi:phenylpyruvate tautomerase PptA (4-oxalocrotonate tautomerase family)
MPIMNVNFSAGELDATAKADLARRLTDVMIRMEGGADTEGGRAFAWVIFTEVPQDNWWAGGEIGNRYVAPPGRFLVRVSIPEGYMNAEHKSEVHRWTTDAVLAATDASSLEVGCNIQVIIDEAPEGNWGAGGRTITLASIAESVGLSKTSDRFAWSKAYFDAKGRARRAAGYPVDAGGLWPDHEAKSVFLPSAASGKATRETARSKSNGSAKRT